MIKARDLARLSMCVAMLIGGQLVLSALSGIEIVTVLLLCFAFCYGWRDGVLVAVVFSILRCFIFGFHVNVIILYLLYYPAFALFFGWLGKKLKGRQIKYKELAIIVGSAIIFTFFFTMLDNALSVLLFSLSAVGAKAYFLASLYTLVPHIACTAVTVAVFFIPLTRVIEKIENRT